MGCLCVGQSCMLYWVKVLEGGVLSSLVGHAAQHNQACIALVVSSNSTSWQFRFNIHSVARFIKMSTVTEKNVCTARVLDDISIQGFWQIKRICNPKRPVWVNFSHPCVLSIASVMCLSRSWKNWPRIFLDQQEDS